MDLELFSYHLSRSIPGHYNYWLYTYILMNTLFQVGEWLSFTPVYDETWRDNANISYWYMYMYSTLLRRIYIKFRTKPPSSGNCSESDSQIRGYIDIILTKAVPILTCSATAAHSAIGQEGWWARRKRWSQVFSNLVRVAWRREVAKTGRELSHNKKISESPSPWRHKADDCPLVICYIAIENDHRNSGFTH